MNTTVSKGNYFSWLASYFEYIRKSIDKREEELMVKLDLSMSILEKRLILDNKLLDSKIKVLGEHFIEINSFISNFENSFPTSIVADSRKAFEIINRVKYYDIFNKVEEEQRQRRYGSYQLKPSIEQMNSSFHNNVTSDGEEYDEHLYLVQIDSVIPLPYFNIDLSRELQQLSRIGVIVNEVPIFDIKEEDIKLFNQYCHKEG